MSGQFESNLRKELRGIASSKGYRSTVIKLGEMRKRTPIQKYTSFVDVFKSTAPLKARYFMSGGRRNFTELLYQSNVETLTLSREIMFSTAWLSQHAKLLNNFLSFATLIEGHILRSEFEEALSEITNFIESNGWSVWATELYFFLVKASGGFDKLKEVTEALTKKATPRIAALFFACLLDRNDDNYSVDAFFSKWKEIFSNVKPTSLRHYLSFRAVTQLDDGLEEGLASCLSVDVLNSVYDCYETLVDACATSIIENLSHESVESSKHAARALLDCGVKDVRLEKILLLSGESSTYNIVKATEPSQQIYNLLSQIPTNVDIDLPYSIVELLSDISENGSDAEESLSRILHIGVNLKALPFGSSLINLVFKISENDILSPKIDRWINFQNGYFRLEDCSALESKNALVYLKEFSAQCLREKTNSAEAEYLLDVLNGVKYSPPPKSLNGAMLFWLGVNLVKQERCDEAEQIVPLLNKLGKHWERQANKLYVVLLVTSGQLELAVNTATSAIVQTKKFSNELTLPLIFKGRKWNDFRGLDPLAVGIVAFCSNMVQSNASTLYICRMACRAVYKKNEQLETAWSGAGLLYQQMLRFFFKNVWIEENLSLTDISTSQQARLERLGTLQKLFTLDSVNEKEYAEEIKSLTLHQTLWLGLKHINESRVFVNEPAILRWAEKELALDYDRWRRTEVTPPDDNILKEVITKFFSDQGGETIKKTPSAEVTSEQDVLIISIVERLLKRFLLDPADGLNSYLSSRIRHGSLKGTILGPLEEAGLLLTTKALDEIDLHSNANISPLHLQKAATSVIEFSSKMSELLDYCNKEIIRIQTPETPNGKISIYFDKPIAAKVYSEAAKVSSLPIFVGFCFETFWSAARVSLETISNYFLYEFKQKVQAEFDALIDKVIVLGDEFEPLFTAIRSASTATQLQCDAVASWFLPEKELEQRIFTLDETIEIANKATRNVYRLFNARITKDKNESLNVPLTAYGLTTVSDCLYIILENAWKHSGFDSDSYNIDMSFSFDPVSSLLRIQIKNPLSDQKLHELKTDRLAQIQKKYENGPTLEMVPVEGGSGIPKLAKISRYADDGLCEPLKIDIDEQNLFSVTIHIPLYKRGDAYDAYYQ
jgi:hypothetical protein